MTGIEALWLTGLLLAQSSAALPDLFDRSEHDFGSLPRGTVATTEFVLTNDTDALIRAERVTANCQCVTPTVQNWVAKPGQQLLVEVAVDTHSFAGEREGTVTVHFAEPSEQKVELRVAVVSRGEIVVQPGRVDLGVLARGQRGEGDARIEYAGPRDWRIVDMAPATWVVPDLREVRRDAGGVEYRLLVRLRPDAPPGELHETIGLRTNDPRSPIVPVQVTATVQAALSASPNFLRLGPLEVGEKAVRKVVLRADEPFELESWSGGREGVDVTCTTQKRTVHVVTVRYTARQLGIEELDLELVTSLEEEGTLPLRVIATVEPRPVRKEGGP